MFELNELIQLQTACLKLKIICAALSSETNESVQNAEQLIDNFNYKLNGMIKELKQQKEDLNVSYSDKIY
tara:strand:+ start:785 stop:994 length:210 start_codon:yes stop_codon:yes gene_type:complete